MVNASAGTVESPVFSDHNRLKFGVFHLNCTRGGTASLGEGGIDELNWPQQVRIARLADQAGIDAIVPIGRWKGYGGPSNFNGDQYEPFPWAAAIGAVTERIAVFATAHVPLIHPVRLAKEAATIDHITGGRFCLNVVAGWNKPELDMFGVPQVAHEERYEIAAEWTTLLRMLWERDEEFDFDGKWFTSRGAISSPKPLQRRPALMSAGSSPAGMNFAAGNADICFAASDSVDSLARTVQDIRALAAEKGRTVSVWTQVGIICGTDEADVQRQYDYWVKENGDYEAVTNQMRLLIGGGGKTLDYKLDRGMLERMIAMTHSTQLYGTPEQIVEKMAVLSATGVDGVNIIWPDYERGIAQLRDEILPLAVDAGLRAAV